MASPVHEHDVSLGEGVCVLCLEEIGDEPRAKRARFAYRGSFEGGAFERVADDYAHVDCAMESSTSGWIVDLPGIEVRA